MPPSPDAAAEAVASWGPDVLFAHGLDDASIEARVLNVAPTVFVEHTYHGTCISSAKTMRVPSVRACDRRFGPACLALYFPRRCGGLNPVTMMRLYATQSRRLQTVRSCQAVVTLSNHMRRELLNHGVPPDRVHLVPPFISPADGPAINADPADSVCRLLFLGRLEPLKGVDRLIAAMPMVCQRLGRRVRLTIAGEGSARQFLEARAALSAASDKVEILFAGWQGAQARATLLAQSHALVVPSLWPEPFGLVGLEAAAAGVPAVAFATGGIPEWLSDGENGCLALAQGARPEALAEAIVRCVASPEQLARLSSGARKAAAAWTLDKHVARLEEVLAAVSQTSTRFAS